MGPVKPNEALPRNPIYCVLLPLLIEHQEPACLKTMFSENIVFWQV